MKVTLKQIYNQQYVRIGVPELDPRNLARWQLLFRKISPYVSWVFINIFNWRAHQVNIFRIFTNIVAIILLATGNLLLMFFGMLLFIFTALVDMCDGEVARVQNDVTLMGTQVEVYDHKLIGRLFHFAMCFSVFLATGRVYMIIVGIISSVFYQSIAFETMCWEIVHCRLWELRSGKRQYKIKNPKEVDELGKTNKMVDLLEKSGLIKLYTDPFDKFVFTAIILVELSNKVLNVLPPFAILSIILLIYAVGYLLLQISSFYFNILKKPAIDDYYYKLFYKRR